MLREKYDLTDVIRVVSELSIDRLDDGVRLAANRDVFREVIFREWLDRIEKSLPPIFPKLHERFASVFDQLEFGVTVPIGFLAIGRKKVRPPRSKITSYVFDD